MLFILTLVFIGIALSLSWYLIAHDRGEREPVAALWLAAGFGVAGALIAAFIEKRFIPVSHLLPGASTGTLLISSLGVGFIEELSKFLPLAVFLYSRRYFNEHSDGIIYFALAGLAFGLPENILYTFQFGTRAGLARVILTPIFHAAITGAIGYFFAKNKLAHRPVAWMVIPIVMAALLHGFYDFGLVSGSIAFGLLSMVITLTASASLFVLYLKATEHDQDAGLAAVGHNSFCRSCGFPNPQHHIYCTHCGQRA